MSEPPMPSMQGMLSSMGPALCGPGRAPSSSARRYANAASRTRKAIAQAHGPCARANPCAKESASALMMKLMSPCACRVTFFERCRATTGNPRRSKSARRACGSGAAYSTNSKPSVPIGFSKSSGIADLRRANSYICNYYTPWPACNELKAMPKPVLLLENFLPYRLSVLTNLVSSAIAGAYRERFGLSIPEWRVLAVLASSPDLSAADVAQRTAMDKVAVSRAVRSLLKTARLERRMARADRRRSVLRLTAAGRHIHAG